jgi:hypothetical protein
VDKKKVAERVEKQGESYKKKPGEKAGSPTAGRLRE